MTEQLDLFVESNREEPKVEKIVMPPEPKREVEGEPTPKKPYKEQKELTPRQRALYRLIFHNSIVKHRKTGQREICDKINGYEYRESNNTSDCCSTIWTDVTANNLSFEHEKVIITENYEYWIGSEAETKDFINNLWNQLSPRLFRYWFYLKKIENNGQGKCVSDQNVAIDSDSSAREFIESFNPFDISKGE